jgi:hypothetical protein
MAATPDKYTDLQRRAVAAGADALAYIDKYLSDKPTETEEEATQSTDELVSAIMALTGSQTTVKIGLYLAPANESTAVARRVAESIMEPGEIAGTFTPSPSAASAILTGMAIGQVLVIRVEKGMVL